MSRQPTNARAAMVLCGVVLIAAGVLVMAGETGLAAPLLLLGLGIATALSVRRWPPQ